MKELESTTMHVRLPPRRDVPITPRIADVIDHPVFQRMRRVRQLGPLSLIYPGATHTRFEHSIGVYGVVLDYLRAILRDPASASLTTEDLEACMLAGLLHDLGHYPFAHSLEASHTGAVKPPRHEALAEELIFGRLSVGRTHDPTLATVIARNFSVSPEEVVALISQPAHGHARATRRLMASVISSGIDADKSDYLERDAHHMGLPFGSQFDRARLLNTLVIHPHGDSIALRMSGRMAAESFVFARYAMFSEAYWHHTARAVSAMIEEALRELQRGTNWRQEELRRDIITQDDGEFLAAMHERAPEDSGAAHLLDRLRNGRRVLHKRILTLTLAFADPSLRTAYDRLYGLSVPQLDAVRAALRTMLEPLVGRAIAEWELLIDTPPRDKDRVESIAMVRGGVAEPLAYRSQIVRGVETDFIKVVKKIRIFVAPDIRDRLSERLSRAELEERLVQVILDFHPERTSQQRLFEREN